MAVDSSPPHPGRVLAEDILPGYGGMTQAELAGCLGISRRRVNEIVNGVRGVSPDTALRLERVFGIPAEFWLQAQAGWDLHQARGDRALRRELSGLRSLGRPRSERPAATGADRTARRPARRATQLVLEAARDPAIGSSAIAHYRRFLEQRGLLRDAERFVRIHTQIAATRPAAHLIESAPAADALLSPGRAPQ